MHSLAILLIGFSLFSAVVVGWVHFRQDNYKGQLLSQSMGIVLLLVLAALQLVHFAYLQHGLMLIHHPVYQVLLFAVAPTFYLFSRPLLLAQPAPQWRDFLHLLPILAAPFLPFALALPLAFAVGVGYLLWLARRVYALRAQRDQFRRELAVLAGVALLAVIVSALGLALPLVPETVFFSLYACAIGGALLLVSLTLPDLPQLPGEVEEAARATYAVSTLGNVDCGRMLVRLANLMDQEQVYQDPALDLAGLSGRMGLSPHQLSELINTRLGKGFSRYIREYRVEAAEDLLLDKPSMPVLSVGMEVGFSSQSNFYDAFRELTGMTPGQFRKVHQAK